MPVTTSAASTGREDGTDQIRVFFDHTASGLMIGWRWFEDPRAEQDHPSIPLRMFAIAGGDGQWKWIHAKIETKEQSGLAEDTVVCFHEKVPHPVAVRYAWMHNPYGCNLYNKEGLPASPFNATATVAINNKPVKIK